MNQRVKKIVSVATGICILLNLNFGTWQDQRYLVSAAEDAAGTESLTASSGSDEVATEAGTAIADGDAEKESESKSTAAESDWSEHLEISIGYWEVENELALGDDDAVLCAIEEMFNVTFVPQNVTWDNYNEKIKLWAESGSLPDLFAGDFRKDSIFYEWVENGLICALPDDLSAYPNLESYLDKQALETCMVDGKIYCIFRQTYSEQAETIKDRTILYRWDLAQEAGITKEPETWDEFREMIQAIIAADPEGKGIGGMTAKGYNMLIGPLFTYSIPMAHTGGHVFYWVPEADGYVPAIFAGDTLGSDALATWQLVREMYEEGTIEEDIVLTTTAQAEEKFLSGKSAAICIDGGISNSKTYDNIAQYWEEVNGADFFDDVKYLNLMPSVDGEYYYTVWGYAWSESYISASVSEEKLERILAIYDYLLSEEGTLLSHFGFEGETYCLDEDGNVTILTEENPAEIYPSIGLFTNLVSWNYADADSSRFPSTVPQKYVDADEARVESARNCVIPEYEYRCTQILMGMGSDFVIDVNSIFLRIMTGTEPVEDLWAQIIDEYLEAGLLDVIEAVNQAME